MKPKTTSTALSLPATQPPPRKEDIINAMVERARVKHQAEASKLSSKRSAILSSLNNAVQADLAKNPENFDIRVRGSYCSPEVTYGMKSVPAYIKKLQKEYDESPTMRNFDEQQVKRNIREGMSSSSSTRVKALLDSPEAVKKLDQALESIGC